MATTLKFCPLQSCVDVSFWSELGSRKLDEYKLAETPIDITGYLTASRHEQIGSLFQVLGSSFGTAAGASSQQGSHAILGQLILTNTLESMRRIDKAAALQRVGQQMWADILSGAAEAQPQLLSRFLLLAHGDLKHFVFQYWFAFPALKPAQPFQQLSATPLAAAYPQQQLQQQICTAADTWRTSAAAGQVGSRSSSSSSSNMSEPAMFLLMQVNAATNQVQTAPLTSWKQLTSWQQQQPPTNSTTPAAAAEGDVQTLLVMYDPCQLQLTPGWPLRNALLLAAARWQCRQLTVLCVRDGSAGRASAERSYVLQVELPEVPSSWLLPAAAAAAGVPQAVGWEADARGKLLPRQVDVSPLMSPVQLAEQAVDLNLRLMRWRAAPELDIAQLAASKCLLLGAGTLGCAVARTLQAWGIRHITLLDSSSVSYSNPVRQSLFTFEDCLAGGKPKAQAAADALKAIFPSVAAAGVALSIPMPGHPPANAQQEQQMQQAAEHLQDLVERHDVIFLLTDTRESRWLPSLLAAAAGKIAITAALGFDNFVVMRHGLPLPAAAAEGEEAANSCNQKSTRLGCYFCNDVVAPLNSTIDRTLDQQCTVARPGLAPIAGAVAVELMAALLQHPLKGHAPAPLPAAAAASGIRSMGGSSSSTAAAVSGALGPVPHMIRGQLSGFSQTCMVGQGFSQCTACSAVVLERYRSEGWGFVKQVLQQPSMLEELTGLAELHRQAAAMALSDSEGEEEEQRAAGRGIAANGNGDGEWTEL